MKDSHLHKEQLRKEQCIRRQHDWPLYIGKMQHPLFGHHKIASHTSVLPVQDLCLAESQYVRILHVSFFLSFYYRKSILHTQNSKMYGYNVAISQF